MSCRFFSLTWSFPINKSIILGNTKKREKTVLISWILIGLFILLVCFFMCRHSKLAAHTLWPSVIIIIKQLNRINVHWNVKSVSSIATYYRICACVRVYPNLAISRVKETIFINYHCGFDSVGKNVYITWPKYDWERWLNTWNVFIIIFYSWNFLFCCYIWYDWVR